MSVHTTLGFLPDVELFRHERPIVSNLKYVIEDIRGHERDFNVDKNGFELVPFHTKMAYEDFANGDKIVAVYMPEVAGVIQRLVGAFRVQIFEYVIRKQHEAFPLATGEEYEHNQPTTMVHIDISKDWARRLAEYGGISHNQ